MKFAVMGAGEYGSKYGGFLVNAGLDVTFIARGQRYEDIKRNGLSVQADPHGRTTNIDHVKVTDTPAEVGPVDVIVFAVKNYHLEEAAEQIKPLIRDDTVILPLQNGVTAPERIAAIVGRKHVLGYATSMPVQSISEWDGPVTPRIHKLWEVLNKTEVKVKIVDDIRIPLWEKVVNFAGGSPMMAARVDFGQANASREIRQLVWEANEEAAAVARAEGIDLEPGVGDRMLAVLESYSQTNPRWRPSFLKDLDAGRRTELEDLVGIIVHKGQEHDVPTPVIRVCYMALKPYEMGTPPSIGKAQD